MSKDLNLSAKHEPVTEEQVEKAWAAYEELHLHARDKPALHRNEYYTALQETAYARFKRLFDRLGKQNA